MPQIRPITDLRNTNEITKTCHRNNEPIFITKNGYGDMVIMSIETYEQMVGVLETDLAIPEAVSAEEEVENGAKLLNAKDALFSLRRKDIGSTSYTLAAGLPNRTVSVSSQTC